jgi:surface antigen
MADTDIDAVKYMSHVKKYNRYALQNNTCDMYKSSLRSGTFIIKDERYTFTFCTYRVYR